ncbi:MAG: 2,3-dehydroadipyl-CoA hydratase [Phycisphaerae bacterium]|nr:2,3-dehydroadipyl-CoA hydratase [Phycisphaerae bacterium]
MRGVSEILKVERHEAWLELTLNRPEARNALSRALIAELTEAFEHAAADGAVRALIVSAAPPAFCSGLDLREVAATDAAQAELDASALLRLFETIDRSPRPVIAAVNGPAVAGGAGLASVCDIVVCGRSAVIGYPEIKRGLVAAIVMTYLRRLVGERQAKYLLLTGENLSAERAVEFNLANEVVADAELMPRARHYARLFASYPPEALAETKRLMGRIRGLEHGAAVEEARRLNASMRLSAESRAGVRKFLGN